jgi:hypothetical protein
LLELIEVEVGSYLVISSALTTFTDAGSGSLRAYPGPTSEKATLLLSHCAQIPKSAPMTPLAAITTLDVNFDEIQPDKAKPLNLGASTVEVLT